MGRVCPGCCCSSFGDQDHHRCVLYYFPEGDEMVAKFLSGVSEILAAMLSQLDAIFALYLSGAVISSFFALWVIKRVLIFFDIIKN